MGVEEFSHGASTRQHGSRHAASERRESASPAVLGLGSNVGDRRSWLQRAVQDLSSNGLEVVQASSLYLTEPVDYPDQAWFLNQALLVRTRLPPYRLLARCLEVEEALGRQRRLPKGPRVIDVDILLYADRILSDRKVTIPHPRFHLRRFALTPVAEIAAGWKHPRLGLSVAGLLDRCQDPAQVVRVA